MDLGKKWPWCVTESEDYISFGEECIRESIEISHTLGIQEIAIHNITELLKSHDEGLSNGELLQLETVSFSEELSVIDSAQVPEQNLNTKEDSMACLNSAEDLKGRCLKG